MIPDGESFHTYHNAKIEYFQEILEILEPKTYYQKEYLLEEATRRGYSISSREAVLEDNLTLMNKLEIIQRTNNISLTTLGENLRNIFRNNHIAVGDLIHYLYYSHFDLKGRSSGSSWSYKNICSLLMQMSPVSITAAMKDHIASMIAAKAENDSEVNRMISISPRTVNGVINWLSVIQPPCLRKKGASQVFEKRVFAPPPLFALAVNFVYQAKEATYGVPIVLTDENIGKICGLCLLEKDKFEEVIRWSTETFDFLHEVGGWERQILLEREPNLDEVFK